MTKELELSADSDNVLLRAGYACIIAAELMPKYEGNWKKYQELAAGLKTEAIRVVALEAKLQNLQELVYGPNEDEDAKELHGDA